MMSSEGEKERPPRPPPSLASRPVPATPEQEFEHTYREAYRHIDRGIILITEGHKAQAGFLLQQGLTLIDKALATKVESFDCSAEKSQLYAEMQLKMRCTRKEVLSHFADTQISDGGGNSSNAGVRVGDDAPPRPEPPPSYDDYLKSLQSTESSSSSSSSSHVGGGGEVGARGSSAPPPLNYPNLGDVSAGNMALGSGGATPIMSPQNGERIFQIENGVQIFFIYPDGRVTSPSYPAFLAVFTFQEPIGGGRGEGGIAGARGFLQVGEWSYPLVPARSPVLHSFYGAYMFPDVSSGVEGTSVGVILPDTVDKESRELFEQILNQMTQYQEQQPPPGVDVERETSAVAESTSERIAAGAEVVSHGVVWGAGKLSELITYGSDNLKTRIQPEQEKRAIDPKWQKTAEVARTVSGKAVSVSGYLLGQIGKATMALGRRVAPHIQHQGTKAITHFTGRDQQEASADGAARKKMDGVMEVAAGAVRGASTIYMGLETAAATLATNLTQNTVKVVTHKYGEEVGNLTDNTLYAVGQTAWAGHNIASLGVKGVAKRAAKDTGKALIHHHEEKKSTKVTGQIAGAAAAVEETKEVEEVIEGVEEGKEVFEHQSPVRPVREKKKLPI